MKEKNPATLWMIVGICFAIVVVTWIPLTIQRMSQIFVSLSEQTKTTSTSAKGLWELQAKPSFENVMNQVSQFASSTQENQGRIIDFFTQLKEQLLRTTSTSSSSTTQ